MRSRSSILVGRDPELRIVEDALASARAGSGGALFLVGESGIGKSRLAAAASDLAFASDMVLLRGRASAVGPMVPFRSLTEALLSLLRRGEPIDVAALGPYRPVLARLIPDWGPPAAEQAGGSLVILAEAVLRLTALVGAGHGCLMVLDDLQDADAETLAVLEYLIDNLAHQPTLLLGLVRAEPCQAHEVARSSARRGTGRVLDLGRLDHDGLGRIAASCLDVAPAAVPEAAVELLWAGSAGNPFLIEELLGGMVDSGLLVEAGDDWRMAERGTADMPVSVARTVARRVEALGPQARELLSVAAVVGGRFPLAIVGEVTGLPDRELLNYLHSEHATQLVAVDDQIPDWYAFRHSLLAEALLTLLTPVERARLASQVADAVEVVFPGLPGEWCQACAALRLDAGDLLAAGLLFAEAGRRYLAQGAANTAVALLDRAWDLLAGADPGPRALTLESLLHALAEAGLVERAIDSIAILDEIGGLDPRRRAELHTRLAWAAAVAGRSEHGLSQLRAARTLLGPNAAAEDLAPIDVVAAHLALDEPGEQQLRTAEDMARRAAIVAEAVPLPVVACQAWQLAGLVTRSRDPDEGTACLERARELAVRHDLPIWEIHALVKLGNDDALRDGSIERLEQARRQATTAGAVTARYIAEQSITLCLVLNGDFATAEAMIEQVLSTAARLKLLETVQFLLLNRAILAAHRGRRREMDEALVEFRRWEGDVQPQYASRVYGLGRAFCALLEENRERAVTELAQALRAEEENPTVMQLSGRYGLHLLLGCLDGTLDWPAFEERTSVPAAGFRWDRLYALFARAVLEGRAGRHDEATGCVEEAVKVGAPYEMGRHLGLRLVSEAAQADGWGTPVDWLRAAEEYFHNADISPVASACRGLLRDTGVRVGQRRGGVDDIPASLRAVGVTAREYEVLLLLGDRLANREIADRLHLSTRTVEKHVSGLITKTGRPNRIALSEFAADAVRR
ncbi:helix-turn-helix transcriptional regulator [Actinophytocola oryzae]|uniref:Regulatory LuxR family protein n=1 Tax=Actinophytocola oryzae TaxID=502181 RepID=A0A4R7VZV7_9PSEU|nr:LuxR family transcriptional regulator [Actinophytocola oryzae]TDV54797.1 regulatory LuxR family protein [Actinophytocola oryzae]